MLGTPSVSCSKQSAVFTEQESLGDFVRRVANEKGITYREVARRGGISSPSISDIISGKTRQVKPSTISALAKGLGVSEYELFAVLRGKPINKEEQGNEEKERIWAMYTDIPRQCQKDVLDLLQVLQRNHSISARRERQAERRREVAGPTRVATPLPRTPEEHEAEKRALGEEPILPARRRKQG
jgi:transcriptional regulator with XRE-family HTH domain